MICLGIDIGITGAVAAVDSFGSCAVADIPTTPVTGKRMVKRRIDSRALILLIREYARPGHAAIAVIEDIHAGTGPGSVARASLMHSRGVVETLLEIARIDYRVIQPAAWKRHHGLTGATKADSLTKARSLYPAAQHLLKRAKDHNRADAILMAHFLHGTAA